MGKIITKVLKWVKYNRFCHHFQTVLMLSFYDKEFLQVTKP